MNEEGSHLFFLELRRVVVVGPTVIIIGLGGLFPDTSSIPNHLQRENCIHSSPLIVDIIFSQLFRFPLADADLEKIWPFYHDRPTTHTQKFYSNENTNQLQH